MSLFVEFSIVLLIAAVVGGVGLLLRQPLIVAFIAVGIFVGPSGLDIVTAEDEMELLATIGIAVLLFVVGLKLDLHVIRTMGPVALATGLGQVAFTSIVGFFIALALGMSSIHAVYVAVALTFSSTIIIVKLLSDKREIDALHGRIAVGFLIVQDLVVVVVMIVLAAMSDTGQAGEGESIAWIASSLVLKGAAFLAGLGLLMRFVIPRLVQQLAKSQELLILFAIAWAVGLATLGEMAGFSKEVGAFLAGVSLASTTFRETINSRLVSVRDFLLLFFFVHLGATLDLGLMGQQIMPAIILSLFVLIGNPIIVLVIMGAMGYRKRTSFLAGLTVAQISEFSLILATMGVTLGHIDTDTLGLITLVGLITIALSTYLILYSHPIYERIAPLLSIFERDQPHRELAEVEKRAMGINVILFGLGRYGSNIASSLHRRDKVILGIDFDPQVVSAWTARGLEAQYGDAEDPEFAASLPLKHAEWVVCTVPTVHTNLTILRALREHDYGGRIALTAHTSADANLLQEQGADLVLLPFVDAAQQAAATLCSSDWDDA